MFGLFTGNKVLEKQKIQEEIRQNILREYANKKCICTEVKDASNGSPRVVCLSYGHMKYINLNSDDTRIVPESKVDLTERSNSGGCITDINTHIRPVLVPDLPIPCHLSEIWDLWQEVFTIVKDRSNEMIDLNGQSILTKERVGTNGQEATFSGLLANDNLEVKITFDYDGSHADISNVKFKITQDKSKKGGKRIETSGG